MKSVVALVFIACLPFVGCSSPTPPPSKPSPYSHVPPSAKGILVSMQKLRAKLTIGISYKDYESDVASIYADVSVFVQSPEGKELPELATLFNNASGCYLKVREIWGRSFEGGQASFLSPREQAQYSSFMAEAFAGGGPKPIWDTASVNIDLAAQLVNNAPESLDSVRHAMEEKSSKLSVSSIEIKLPTVP